MPHAVTTSLLFDRASLENGGRRSTHAVLALKGLARGVDAERPPLSIVFAVDVSGSMRGQPLEHVIDSLGKLLAILEPRDRAGLVVFSNQASALAELMALTPSNRALLTRRIRSMRASGGTNVEAGLRAARALLPERQLHERQLVMLLSDGQPNDGVTSRDGLRAIAASCRPDVAVSSLGYGAHHDEDVLGDIALGGGGEYVFIHDPRECEFELARAVGSQGEVVAERVELVLQLEEHVELVDQYSASPPRFAGGSVKLRLPDVFEGLERVVALELAVDTPKYNGPLSLGSAHLSYVATGDHDETRIALAFEIGVTSSPGALAPEVDAQVLLGRADRARSEARRHADRGNYDSAAAVVRGFMAIIEAAPAYVAGDGSALSEIYEQLVDEAVAYETRPSAEQYRHYKRAFMGVEGATGGVHASDRKGAVVDAMVSAVVGEVPKGQLIVTNNKAGTEERYPVLANMSLGRIRGNDIVVPRGNVSKRHTRFVVQNGELMVVDLKSTNGTYVNGERVVAPKVIGPEDIVYVGDAKIRFEPDEG